MEQIFLNESCRFYTRTAKGEKPQMMYCHINLKDNRFVIGTAVKVNPQHFNTKKQRALVSNELTELENRNNTIVNEAIKEYYSKYLSLVNYLQNNPDDIEQVDKIIYTFVPMKRKGNKNNGNAKANKKTLYDTLEYIFNKELDEQIKDKKISLSRKDVKVSQLALFYDFLKVRGFDNVWATLTPSIWREYTDYLKDEKKNKKGENLNITYINGVLSALKNTVNSIIDRDEEGKYAPVDTSRWKLLDKQITNSEKKTANYIFSEEQLQRVMALELDGNAEIVRDLFTYMCFVGQRPADCVRLLKGEGKRFTSNGIEVISLLPHKTRKTDKRANVPLFQPDIVDTIIERFNTRESYIDYLNKTDKQRNALNSKWIKIIFEMAGLTDTFEATSQRGTEVQKDEKNQAETAHLYLARHYFITYMCRHGIKAEEVIEMTGHTTAQQIRDTYAHLTAEDEANTITSNEAVRRLAGKSVPDSQMVNNTPQPNELDSLIREIKLCKMGFYNNISSSVKSKVKETAIFNNCSIEKACDILLANLE